MISRVTLTTGGFELLSFDDGGAMSSDKVDIRKAVLDQEQELVGVLEKVALEIESQEMEHRERFKDKKLVNVFPETVGYYVEKLFELHKPGCGWGSALASIAELRKSLSSLESQLKERAGGIDAYPSVSDDSRHVLYALAHLERFAEELRDNVQPGPEVDMIHILASFVRSGIDSLREATKEIDDDYDRMGDAKRC